MTSGLFIMIKLRKILLDCVKSIRNSKTEKNGRLFAQRLKKSDCLYENFYFDA